MNPWDGRHPGVAHFERMFEYDHLPVGRIRDTSAVVCSVAETMVRTLPDGAELTAGLRNLWDAKNNFVIAAVMAEES